MNVIEGIYREDSPVSDNDDIYEAWDEAILQTLKNSPMKVRIHIKVYSKFYVYKPNTRLDHNSDASNFIPVTQVLVLQIVSGLSVYVFGKFACKVKIQEFSFAAPLSAVVPVAATLILAACGARYIILLNTHDTSYLRLVFFEKLEACFSFTEKMIISLFASTIYKIALPLLSSFQS